MLKLSMSYNRMVCIELHEASLEDMKKLKSMVTCNVMDMEDYQTSSKCCAFLQGYDESSGWILIEFWNPKYAQDFVDYANKLLSKTEKKSNE